MGEAGMKVQVGDVARERFPVTCRGRDRLTAALAVGLPPGTRRALIAAGAECDETVTGTAAA
ncbi:hypothetical protein ACIBQ1_61240 [Nonomuraea sp. NPDC050153]|uniref:hypothetical protein n=1 Tax=Nonomuraea sp. NPDC050153 TaxID=3364359 RepID=UPI0037AE9BE9